MAPSFQRSTIIMINKVTLKLLHCTSDFLQNRLRGTKGLHLDPLELHQIQVHFGFISVIVTAIPLRRDLWQCFNCYQLEAA